MATMKPINIRYDTKGNPVGEFIYDYVTSFSNGWASVRKDDKCGLIDTSGRVVIPCKYEYTEPFSANLAIARKDGVNGFIDKWCNDTFSGRNYKLKVQKRKIYDENVIY